MTKDAAKERIIEELNNRSWSDLKIMEILLSTEDKRERQDLKTLIMAAAMANNIKFKEVLSSKRTKPYVLARAFCYWKLREEGYSFHYIGDMFGRTHATVINSLKKIQNDFDTNYRENIVKFDYFKELIN